MKQRSDPTDKLFQRDCTHLFSFHTSLDEIDQILEIPALELKFTLSETLL